MAKLPVVTMENFNDFCRNAGELEIAEIMNQIKNDNPIIFNLIMGATDGINSESVKEKLINLGSAIYYLLDRQSNFVN